METKTKYNILKAVFTKAKKNRQKNISQKQEKEDSNIAETILKSL